MKKSTEPQRLPNPPERTIFRLNRDGEYHHTVMKADLCLNLTDVRTGRFVTTKPNFSKKSGNKSENAG